MVALGALIMSASFWTGGLDSALQSRYDQIAYQTGKVAIGGKLATVNLGEHFKYVGESDAEFILTKVWGNPPGSKNLGMVFPIGGGPLDSTGWAIVIQYSDDGYVKDDDAKDADYDDVLKK